MKNKHKRISNFKNIMSLFLLMALFVVSIGFYNKKNESNVFYISGSAALEDSTMLVLQYPNAFGDYFYDTTFLNKGHFSFKGAINEPTRAYIECKPKSKKIIENELFIEPKKMQLSYRLKNAQYALLVTGSKTNNEYEGLKESQLIFHKQGSILVIERNKIYDSMNKVIGNQYLQYRFDSLQKKLDSLNRESYNLDLAFVTAHPASFLSPFLLHFLTHSSAEYPIKSAAKLYDRFLPEVKNSFFGKQIAIAIATQVGGTEKDFSAINLNGDLVNLSSFKHKSYVLLDFWATWCKPCRNSSPYLVEAYNKYHLKGLEIIGIANDDKRVEKWKKAIEEDKTGIFYQVLQGVGTKKNIGDLYSVMGIPDKILIDKEGTIVYRSIGDEDDELKKKLAEIFEL